MRVYHLRTLNGKRRRYGDDPDEPFPVLKKRKNFPVRLPCELLNRVHLYCDWDTRRSMEDAFGWSLIPHPLAFTPCVDFVTAILKAIRHDHPGCLYTTVLPLPANKRYEIVYYDPFIPTLGRHWTRDEDIRKSWVSDPTTSTWHPRSITGMRIFPIEQSFIMKSSGRGYGLHEVVREMYPGGVWYEYVMETDNESGVDDIFGKWEIAVYKGNTSKGKTRPIHLKATCAKHLTVSQKRRMTLVERGDGILPSYR